MQIEFTRNGKRAEVNDRVAAILIAAKLARAVVAEVETVEAEKPKRQYRRRDMKAE